MERVLAPERSVIRLLECAPTFRLSRNRRLCVGASSANSLINFLSFSQVCGNWFVAECETGVETPELGLFCKPGARYRLRKNSGPGRKDVPQGLKCLRENPPVPQGTAKRYFQPSLYGTGRRSYTLPSTACWATLRRPFGAESLDWWVLMQTLKPDVFSIIYGTTLSRALIQNRVFPELDHPGWNLGVARWSCHQQTALFVGYGSF
jgi:hypothetical protein